MASPLGAITRTFLALVLLTATGGAGRDFIVFDGVDGWTTLPAEPHGAFHVNDTLVFRYDKDVDAVLLVSPKRYGACNATEPFLRLDGGESRFALNSRGYYYFISADAGRCRGGERLIVLAVDNRRKEPVPPAPPPAKSARPPSPPRPSAGNVSSSSPASLTAPLPRRTNWTACPPSVSFALALKTGVRACLVVVGGAVILSLF